MGSSLGYARLPLLCIRGWLEDEAPTPEAIINFFTTHRKAIKSKETGSLQTMLSFLMYLNRQSYPSVKKLDIFANCLVATRDKRTHEEDCD
jgi:hypothetical protein